MDMEIQRTDLWTHYREEREGALFFLNIILFTNLWLHWVLVAVRGKLSLAVASAGHTPQVGYAGSLIVLASVWSPSF